MACFLVPAAEAVATTVAAKAIAAKETGEKDGLARTDGAATETLGASLSAKLGWLNAMLWGGSALLAFEHVWHGEVVPFFPFLTAATDPAATMAMLGEMATVGVGMALAVTGAWVVMVLVSDAICRRVPAGTAPAAAEAGV